MILPPRSHPRSHPDSAARAGPKLRLRPKASRFLAKHHEPLSQHTHGTSRPPLALWVKSPEQSRPCSLSSPSGEEEVESMRLQAAYSPQETAGTRSRRGAIGEDTSRPRPAETQSSLHHRYAVAPCPFCSRGGLGRPRAEQGQGVTRWGLLWRLASSHGARLLVLGARFGSRSADRRGGATGAAHARYNAAARHARRTSVSLSPFHSPSPPPFLPLPHSHTNAHTL